MHARYILSICGGVFFLALALLFWEPLFSGAVLFSPDQPPFFVEGFQYQRFLSFFGSWGSRLLGNGAGGQPFHPIAALSVILPPLVYHLASYVVSVLLVLAAGIFFLRGRRVPLIPAFLGGMAMAFAGYYFTLISAGHRGMFFMMPYIVFVFGFLDRAIERRSLFYFAMTGAFAGFALISQPDVAGLFLVLAGAYGVFQYVRMTVAAPGRRGALAARMLIGGLVAAVFLGAVCFGWAQKLTQTILPKREMQIEASGAKSPEEKWIFATNWSMPPEEILEFVAPAIYGYETGDPAGPYWGRVGRTWKWGEHRQGLMNLRQHTVYLGVLQVLFAVFAVVVACGRRYSLFVTRYSLDGSMRGRARVPVPEADAAESTKQHINESTPTANAPVHRTEILFWAIAGVVSVMLALGRYFPLYRAFYALPIASKIRAPIKFIHITELSVAILFAFGVTAFMHVIGHLSLVRKERSAGKKGRKEIEGDEGKNADAAGRLLMGFAVGAAVAGMILFVAAGLAGSFAPAFRSYWQELGLGRFAPLLMERMQAALAHGGVLFLLGAGVFAFARWHGDKNRARQVALCILVLALPADLASVGKKYVRVRDVSAAYAPNPIAERIKSAPEPVRTAYYLSPRSKFDVIWRNFTHHNVYMMNPRPQENLSPDYRAFFEALGENPLRLWQITNTRFVVGPLQNLKQLAEHTAINVLELFDVGNGRVTVRGRGQGANALLEFTGALPRAALYHQWEHVPREKALTRMADAAWNPFASVLVHDKPGVSSVGGGTEQVEIKKHARTHVVIHTRSEQPGLLLLNDKYDPDWRVEVDGRPAKMLRCNYIMRGVALGPGAHTVEFTYRPWMTAFLVSLGACGALVLWGVVQVGRKRKEGASE